MAADAPAPTAPSRRWSNGAAGPLTTDAALSRAKRLLVQRYKVAYVAKELGYASSSAFSAAFRRSAGETPTQYYNRATSAE